MSLLLVAAMLGVRAAANRTTFAPPPFSFQLGAVRFTSSSIVKSWPADVSVWKEGTATLTRATYSQPGGLQVEVVQTQYSEVAGSREWVLSFRNDGAADSPKLCSVAPLDVQLGATLGAGGAGALAFHHFQGSAADEATDYQPLVTKFPQAKRGNCTCGESLQPQVGSDKALQRNTRLWGAGVGSAFHAATDADCIQGCLKNQRCIGATLSLTNASGIRTCYLLSSFNRAPVAQVGYSSFTTAAFCRSPAGGTSRLCGDGWLAISPSGGRPSNGVLPYFQLLSDSASVVYSVGWSGNWLANVSSAGGLASATIAHGFLSSTQPVRAMDALCTKLHPGESMRSMRIMEVTTHASEADEAAVLPGGYGGLGIDRRVNVPVLDEQTGFNKHRKVVLLHKIPRDPRDGELNGAVIASWSWINWPQCPGLNISTQLQHVNWVKESGVEAYWLDAGWFDGCFPNGAGNWTVPLALGVNHKEFPQGLAPLGDRAHAAPNRVQNIVWIEPERAVVGSYVERTFPEYVLRATGPGVNSAFTLLNLGNPDANAYIEEFLTEAIDTWQLDWLRIDYNIDPRLYWQSGDAADRVGSTEVRYVQGLYSLWDSLLAEHAGMQIDDCSSGGRRIDLETISRSTPLWRSDAGCEDCDECLQQMSMALSWFSPISAGAVWSIEPYRWRSAGILGKTISWGLSGGAGAPVGWTQITKNATSKAQLRLAIAETQSLRPIALADDSQYHVLTNITALRTDWAAYMFDSAADRAAGFAFFFRRPHAAQASMVAGLRGLTGGASYSVERFVGYEKAGLPEKMAGAALTALRVALPQKGSLLLRWKRQ